MSDAKKKKQISVFGLFNRFVDMDLAVRELVAADFRRSDISALLPNLESSQAFAHEKHTKAPEGAAIGATSGAIAGGTIGVLLGLGTIAIPGLGALLAAGPIIAALAGAGAGGAVGTMTGALVGLGIPEYEAKRYEDHVKGGGYLLAVHADSASWARRAEVVLRGCGAIDVDEKRESHA